MRFDFQPLPAAGGGELTPRPIIPVFLEGIEAVPLGCLLDSGALRTRFARELGDLAGVDFSGAPTSQFAVGGILVTALDARVTLRIGGDENAAAWDASVSFCDPWPFGFQLLGLDGFLRYFRTTISAYEEWCEIAPES